MSSCSTVLTLVASAVRYGLIVGLLTFAAQTRGADSPGTMTATALAPPSGPAGKTMFTPMSPDETGLRTANRYADPKMWGERYQEFAVGAIGCGVTIGDYDGDGRPDIFVVSKTESCRLFRNLGHWKFEDVTERAGVGEPGDAGLIWKQGASFVDVNNDGRLDIYVCRFNAPNLLYINQGDGTFKEMAHSYGLDIKDACGMAAFCDYDRDGWLDLFVQTNLLNIGEHPNGQHNYLFHNNRDGTFTNVTDRAGITGEAQGHSATWWDFDGDGWPDLYVANDFGTPDKLYHNNRNGTFTNTISSVVPHTTFASMGSDLGDINNDGLVDFFVADMAATSHQMDQRTASDIRAGTDDPSDTAPKVPKYLRNALFVNTGTGRCLEAAYLAGIAATDWTWAVRFEDLDNDGRLDLFVTNGMNREQNNVDLILKEMSAESSSERVRIMRDSPVLVQTHLAFRNLGDLQFENVGAAWGLNQKAASFGAAFGDLDGDGDLDLIYNNYQAASSVLRNDCATGHRVLIDLRGTVSNRFGIGANVKIETVSGVQVRELVLARGYLSSSEPAVHFGLGEDTSIKQLTINWPSGIVQTFENVPVDRRFAITEPAGPALATSRAKLPTNAQFEEVSVASGLSWNSHEDVLEETSDQRLLPVRLNRRGPGLAVGETGEPGQDAVIIAGTTQDPLRILRADEAKKYQVVTSPEVTSGSGMDDGPILLFDADGDGFNDLLVTRGGNAVAAGAPEYQPRLYLNNRQGGFRPAPEDMLPSLPINAGAVAASDFLHNGRLGVFIGGRVLSGDYPQSPKSALLANRGEKFEDVTDSLAPGLREVGMVTAALWSDVDGDGWPDLILTLEWGGLKYFHNNRGVALEDWSERSGFTAAGTGWWTSVAAADFNGDGHMDYVVGNVGLNTPYHADPTHPALLYYGDFKGDGSSQLIEARYEDDRIYPVRSRRDLGATIPAVLKRFPRNDFFARATLAEVLGAERVAKAGRVAATEFRSGVLLSQPDGRFKFEPLPRLSQISPLQGIVAADLDGDGKADIYAVQNSYAPIPSVGRFDGGLSQLLRGDGKGHFTAVPPGESNLIVPRDAKALAMLDFDQDGWPDFVISRNNDTTLAFRNRGVAGRKSVRILLHGPNGNPQAVGARIVVELSDGTKQTAEVYAGSGYYSQSTAACFFGYAETNRPTRIQVQWPSGKTTTQDAGSLAATLTLSPPEP
jgi:hypothetical protein